MHKPHSLTGSMRSAARARQGGITFIGLIILVTFVGLFVYAGIRLAPAYLEYLSVVKALDGLKTETGGGAVTQQSLRIALEKRFDIDDIKSLDWRDVEIGKDGGVYTVRAAYNVNARFIANIDFQVHFDKTVEVPAGSN